MSEQTTKDWRESWKRGADLIVYRYDRLAARGTTPMNLYRRTGERGRTIDTYDGKSIAPKSRRGVPIDSLYTTGRTVAYQRTHMVLQSNGLPALRKDQRKSVWGAEPRTYWSVAEISGIVVADGSVRWFQGSMLKQSSNRGPLERWVVPAEEVLDEYGTRIDELIELASLDLPTGAYKLGEGAPRRNPGRRS